LAVLEIFSHADTCSMPPVCNGVGVLVILMLCPVFTFLQQLMTKRLWVIYAYTCSPIFSIDVIESAIDDPCICWWQDRIIVSGALHMRCTCTTKSHPLSLLVHCWTFRACCRDHFPLLHHASLPLSKRPFWPRGSCFERLDDAFVLLVSLIFLYTQKILISVRWQFEL